MPKKQHQTPILIIKDNQGSKEYVLKDASRYLIGRDAQCDIRLLSHFVSRKHATLERCEATDGTLYYQIADGNNGKASANGLIINGRKRELHILRDQDEIVFGPDVSITYTVLNEKKDEFDITLITPNLMSDLAQK